MRKNIVRAGLIAAAVLFGSSVGYLAATYQKEQKQREADSWPFRTMPELRRVIAEEYDSGSQFELVDFEARPRWWEGISPEKFVDVTQEEYDKLNEISGYDDRPPFESLDYAQLTFFNPLQPSELLPGRAVMVAGQEGNADSAVFYKIENVLKAWDPENHRGRIQVVSKDRKVKETYYR